MVLSRAFNFTTTRFLSPGRTARSTPGMDCQYLTHSPKARIYPVTATTMRDAREIPSPDPEEGKSGESRICSAGVAVTPNQPVPDSSGEKLLRKLLLCNPSLPKSTCQLWCTCSFTCLSLLATPKPSLLGESSWLGRSLFLAWRASWIHD
jgi:hypothetical protein